MRKYIAIVAAAGAMVAVAVPVSGAKTIYPIPCKVPKVVGKTLPAAEAAIIKANCTIGSVSTKKSLTVPKGNVISQSPTSGKGPKVNLVVSLGNPPPTAKCHVPNVIGKQQAVATALIVKANCAVKKVTTKRSTFTKGKVLSQRPTGSTTPEPIGFGVSLTVSSGKKK
jgi:beta-lactam-binding protein with PASTA domain